jgi:hypothetical protein
VVRPDARRRVKQRSWRRAFAAATLTAIATALVSFPSCGPGFLAGLAGGAADGARNGNDDGAQSDGSGCNLAHVPDRPDLVDDGDLSITLAAEAIRLDTLNIDAGAAPARGLDLDGLCTCPGLEGCVGSARDSGPICDAPGGRDNMLGNMFNRLSDYVPQFNEGFANTRIRSGNYTVLITIERWNGKDDDPSIVVTLRNSQGLDQDPVGGSNREDPAFDGTDVWTIEPASLAEDAGNSKIGQDCRDASALCIMDPKRIARGDVGNAWVRGGTLVARFARAPVLVRTVLGTIMIDFDDLTLVGRVSNAPTFDGGTRYVFEGEIVGRWPIEKMLVAMGNMENPATPPALFCQDVTNTFYRVLKENVCSSLDVSNGPAGEPCTMASSAISVLARQSRPASKVYRRKDPASPCVAWKDECPAQP